MTLGCHRAPARREGTVGATWPRPPHPTLALLEASDIHPPASTTEGNRVSGMRLTLPLVLLLGACAGPPGVPQPAAPERYFFPATPGVSAAPRQDRVDLEASWRIRCAQGFAAACDLLAETRGRTAPSVAPVRPAPPVPSVPPVARAPAEPGPRAPRAGAQEANAAMASVMRGQQRLSFGEQRSAGRLVSCGLSFGVGAQDHADRRGGPVVVNGGLDVLSPREGTLIWFLRFDPTDLVWSEEREEFTARPMQPRAAWVSVGRFNSADHNARRIPCETARLCQVSGEGLPPLLEGISGADSMRFGIQRAEGGLDIMGQVSLSRTRSDQTAVADFGRCAVRLLEQALRDLPPPAEMPRTPSSQRAI